MSTSRVHNLALACLSFAIQACAAPQPPTPAERQAAQDRAELAAASVIPAAIAAQANNPKTCDGFVPSGATVERAQATLIAFRVTQTGDVRDVALYRSSGKPELDKAAIACASAFHMPPPIINGKAIEIDLIFGVPWNADLHAFHALAPDGTVHDCPSREWYPVDALRNGQQGITLLELRVATDGSVKNTTVMKSSGTALLDEAAIHCASTWHFFPATQNGTPLEYDIGQPVVWWLR